MIVLGLLIQALALAMLFYSLKRTWVTHIGAIFVVAACVYHGLGEILVELFPGSNPYRPLVGAQYVDEFILWVSVAIFCFTVGYLFCLGTPDEAVNHDTTLSGVATTVRFFDWRLMFLVSVPLLVLTVQGHGYLTTAQNNASAALSTGLAQQFFVLVIVLASVGIVVRFGSAALLPVLLVESAAVSLVGERLVIIWAIAMTLYALKRFGFGISRRTLVAAAVLLVILAWSITSARAQTGRFNGATSLTDRVTSIGTGFAHLFSGKTIHQITGDLGYRLDGDSFGAMEVQALSSGLPPLGLAPLRNDLLLAVPSFINPQKDETDLAYRSEKLWAAEHLNLPVIANNSPVQDIPATQLGVSTGYYGPLGLLIIASLLGIAFARIDAWLSRGVGPARIIIGLGLLYCVMDYEDSWQTYPDAFRGVVAVVAIALALQALQAVGRELWLREDVAGGTRT